MGELEVRDRRLGGRGGERALERERRPAGRARVDVVRLEGLADDALEEEALLVRRLAADDRADAADRAPQPGGGLAQRALPGDRAQLAAVADHRPRDALVDVDGLVGEATLVAQPAVVDARRCRGRGRAGRARRGP